MARALVGLARTVGIGRGFTRLRMVRCDVTMVGGRVYEVEQAFELAGVDLGWESWGVSGPTMRSGEGTPEPELEPLEFDEGRGGPWLETSFDDLDDSHGQ